MAKKQLSIYSVVALMTALSLTACGNNDVATSASPSVTAGGLAPGESPIPVDSEEPDPTMPTQDNPAYYIFALDNERLWISIDANGGYAVDGAAAGEGLFIKVAIKGDKLVETIAYSDGTSDEVSETITGDYRNLHINGWTRLVGPGKSLDDFAEQDCKDMADAFPDAECDLDSLGGKAGMFAGVNADWINAV